MCPSSRAASQRRAFTLIELLVVIAIIAILAIVVVLTLNPSELLKQSRDANRVSDMATLNSALGLYVADQGSAAGFSLGNPSSSYISVSDATISGNATSSCASLGLLSLSTGLSYQCASSQSYRDTDGTGWVPVNFQVLSGGAPFGNLPVDPANQTSTGLFYSYAASGTQYEASSLLESQKYRTQYAQNPMVPGYPGINAKGNSLAVSQLFSPSGLIGYWPMDEGTGTKAYDQSGSGNVASWNGSTTNGTYYAGGKIGSGAGNFNGVNDALSVTNFTQLASSSFTISGWMSIASQTGSYSSMLFSAPQGLVLYFTQSSLTPGAQMYNGSSWYGATCSSAVPLNTWAMLSLVYNSALSSYSIYYNGALCKSNVSVSGGMNASYGTTVTMGAYTNYLNGLLDDVRVYNRALSAAEIQALYNAEK